MQGKRERAREDLKKNAQPPIWQRIQQLLQVKRKKPFISERKPGQSTAPSKRKIQVNYWNIANDWDKISWSLQVESAEKQKWQNRLKRKTIMIS